MQQAACRVAPWLLAGIMLACGQCFAEERPAGSASRERVLSLARRVADAALFGRTRDGGCDYTRKKQYRAGWDSAAMMTGVAALWQRTGEKRYLDAMRAWAEVNTAEYTVKHTDDVCAGYVYLLLYEETGDKRFLNAVKGMRRFLGRGRRRTVHPTRMHYWQDDLYMVPPTLARLGRVTGDMAHTHAALDFFFKYVKVLRDKKTGLFFHDAKTRNAFWGRGNGWVLAGMANLLAEIPLGHRGRERLIEIYRVMVKTLARHQDATGLWHADVIDRQKYPDPEESGSALFVYGIAKGLNRGWIGSEYRSCALRGWAGLTTLVEPSGVVRGIQPPGTGPARGPYGTKGDYGIGAFLLAACEVSRFPEEE